MAKIINPHPGEILGDILEEMEISAYRLSKETGVPSPNIYDIISGKRGISAEISARFGRFFEQSDSFWLNLQNEYDLRNIEHDREKELKGIRTYKNVI
ncbi:HigA family addiction module antitoxin [Leptospira stimsonii]|uniref:Addiction module antidote protein, HigA family n=1 Tax=Leptospira stimsonii TaxID=2202203 RepID=A0ABY2MXB1_9LEPT|nr:HigA family addiction module antitoxin [Leptospira stimsonii]TGK23120.1 addiction module antidote protein, HigA family [Leptospira stimsonii]TGM10886.1 addiction module antidote protein, HigA family [Leptospira stimsonii]